MKKLEKEIEKKFPSFWSKYRMIFFGDFTYDKIHELNSKFEHMLQELYEKRISNEKI